MRQALLAAIMFFTGIGTGSAQSVESDVTPESEHLVKDDHEFAMSSIVPDETLEAAQDTKTSMTASRSSSALS